MNRDTMKHRMHLAWQAVGACALVSLAACGGSGGGGAPVPAPGQSPVQPPVQAPGPAQPPAPVPPAPVAAPPGPTTAFAYVARESADSIAVYAHESVNGSLVAASSLSLPAGSAPRHLAHDPVHHRLYIANYGTNRIEVADAEPATGTLSAARLASTLAEPVKLAVDPQGRFLYAAFGGQHGSLSGVMAFRIDPVDGRLLYVNFLTTFQRPTALAIDPQARYAFLGTYWGVLTPYTIDAGTGALTAGIVTPIGVSDLAFDASGSRLYASNGLSTYTHLFDVQPNGTFSMSQMETLAGMPSKAIALDPAGAFLYTLDPFFKTVQTMRIAASNGQVSAATTLTLGCTPQALGVSPDGASVHVACDGGGALLGHTLDRATGTLSPVATSPTAVGANAVAFVPTP